ncbi:MAG: HAD-IA family hydrolase [Leucobacter sp.]
MTAFNAAPQAAQDTLTDTAPAQTLTARALLLDMDGTLVDSNAAVFRVWTRWATVHGLDPEHVFHLAHGRQGQETMAELLPHRPQEENLADNAELLAAEHEDLDGVIEIPGASTFLDALHGHPHALVTSADKVLAERRIGAAGLEVPEVRVTAEDVTASKPDPEGFLLAARMLGIDPADCIVFEDSKAGVAAGLAAGMQVVGVGLDAAKYNPTVTVADLTSVTVTGGDAGLTVMIKS